MPDTLDKSSTDKLTQQFCSLANLVPYDWDVMENIAFVQDFPMSGNAASSIDELPPFAKDLYAFLTAMKVPAQVCEKLQEYDFTRAQVVSFDEKLRISLAVIFDANGTILK